MLLYISGEVLVYLEYPSKHFRLHKSLDDSVYFRYLI